MKTYLKKDRENKRRKGLKAFVRSLVSFKQNQ